MKRITRDRRLTPEEAAKYKTIREQVAGEMPDLIDRELAVRVEHGEAKSADLTPFRVEMDRFAELHAPSLNRAERAAMRVMVPLRRLGVLKVVGAASRAYRRLRPATRG
jgi:hypothetical protein